MRDILAEAKQWRGYLRPSSPLIEPLTDVPDDVLTEAYQTWWGVYTEGIRKAPSPRRPEGVAERDAKAAAASANAAVLELLEGK